MLLVKSFPSSSSIMSKIYALAIPDDDRVKRITVGIASSSDMVRSRFSIRVVGSPAPINCKEVALPFDLS